MALNNFMHLRNIYRTPPDFSKLAKIYPEFSSISKMDLSGKVTIDFKDPHSLRILTRCLLKSDFNLDVEIPEDRLVPTLPLRLNYILWIEDLLLAIGKKENIRGIDIGTGACAIYPLLAATKNKWDMIGTDTDVESLHKAQENIDKNNLSKFIKLSKNTTSSVVQYLLENELGQTFDFCMCNPPFYSSIHELCESRNPTRHPPKNGFTGSPQELVTEGGELVFCRKLINESKIYKDRVVNEGSSFHPEVLFRAVVDRLGDQITDTDCVTLDEFYRRFARAASQRWQKSYRTLDTFRKQYKNWLQADVDWPNCVSRSFVLPQSTEEGYQKSSGFFTTMVGHKYNLKELLHDLTCDGIKHTHTEFCQGRVTRWGLAWTYQDYDICKLVPPRNKLRKKSLPIAYQLVELPNRPYNVDTCSEKIKEILNQLQIENKTLSKRGNSIFMQIRAHKNTWSHQRRKRRLLKQQEDQANKKTRLNSDCLEGIPDEFMNSVNHNNNERSETQSQVCKIEEDPTCQQPLLQAFLKVFKKDNTILFEIEFLNGSAGKEGLHQIVQYIKNNWK